MKKNASKGAGQLLLENGQSFYGINAGALQTKKGETHVFAEVVFNTSMSGYQEILTDPSYLNQIVNFTYPEIGNYGVSPANNESRSIKASGLICKRLQPYNRSGNGANDKNSDLSAFLCSQHTLALQGVDTRKLTKVLRNKGVMRAVLSSEILQPTTQKKLLSQLPDFEAMHMPKAVTCSEIYAYEDADAQEQPKLANKDNNTDSPSLCVGVIDYGVKTNILRLLKKNGLRVLVFPCNTPAEKLLDANLSGILLSNGPGNPAVCQEEIAIVKKLIGKIPLFGICLGHQILALANGGVTKKLVFGHRGANHPIQTRGKSKIDITSQNHGYAVSLPSSSLQASPNITRHAKKIFQADSTLGQLNLNDFTVAGYRNYDDKAFAVQYHPEASPGPHDSQYLFADFKKMMQEFSQK